MGESSLIIMLVTLIESEYLSLKLQLLEVFEILASIYFVFLYMFCNLICVGNIICIDFAKYCWYH